MSNPEVMTYIPFAMNGEKSILQVYRQSGQDEEDATLSEGFPKITMIPESSGGIAPKGLDMNGALYQLSVDTVHRQKGKQIQYDSTYATNIGGYSKGAILQSTDLTKSYISTVDNNLTDPDSSASSGWNVYAQTPTATSTTTGTVKIADNLTSTAKDTALTANQGRILNTEISNLTTSIGAMFASASMQKNGYFQIKDVNGNVVFMVQWGTVDYDSYPNEIQVDITFPQPFPNNCFTAQATRKMSQHSSNGDGGANLIGTPTKKMASFSLQQYEGNYWYDLRGFTWFAIGN